MQSLDSALGRWRLNIVHMKAQACPRSIPASRNQENRQIIREMFSSGQTQEDLIFEHNQIIGLKPVIRRDLNYHTRALGMDNFESTSHSKAFYCPTFHNFGVHFPYD